MRRILAISVLLLLAGGCAPSVSHLPRSDGTVLQLARPGELPGIENFAQVTPGLYRGAQPTPQGLAELQRLGIRTVVNLRDEYDERSAVQSAGLNYVAIPASPWTIGQSEVERFLKLMREPANLPVFVHCHRGADRTGCAVAAYRVVEQNWSADEAIAEMKQFDFNILLGGIERYIRRLDRAQMLQRLAVGNAAPQSDLR